VRGSLICGSSGRRAFVLFVAVFALAAMAEPCAEKSEIIYNAMHLLAGSGDTLAVASFDQKGWALNATTTRGEQWWGYSFECFTDKALFDIAFGNRTLAALFNPADYETYRSKPTTIWWYSYRDAKIRSREVKWRDSVFLYDTLASVNGVDLLAAGGVFFLACRSGGVVKWDPVSNGLRGFIPGDTGSFDPATMNPRLFPRFGASKESSDVIALERMLAADTVRLAVVTPARIWRFTLADSSWDSSVVSTLADSSLTFRRFVSAAVNNTVTPSLLYAFIMTGKGSDSTVSLFRYHKGDARWVRMLTEGPSVMAPASRGYFYTITGANKIELYRDSLRDGATIKGELTPVKSDLELYSRLTVKKGLDRPGNINDMLFIPVTDTSGHFAIAASSDRSGSDGLYLSYAEVPGSSNDEFKLLRRDRVIAGGLKETYALPGILSYKIADTTLFVYKLSKDARVTIRIYDFNMQHVRTVIENAPRKAATATGRSTNAREDIWDGTTASGRMAAPGVYYYKITASSGERSFGKIVVAKGPGL
jgi:hypothetical protein